MQRNAPHVTPFVTRDSHGFKAVTFAVSHGTPSRPVPTRPIKRPLLTYPSIVSYSTARDADEWMGGLRQ